jgi:hypothetical protein
MRFRSGFYSLAALGALCAVLCMSAFAEKLKGYYSGSGGISQEVHRVVFLEFGADGTAFLEQTWQGKDTQTWHAHWKREGKKVNITFDPVADKPTLEPLLLNIKHGTLIPTSWDASALGVLGPPKLDPFGGKNVPSGSVAACQGVNWQDPTQHCVTWDSRH